MNSTLKEYLITAGTIVLVVAIFLSAILVGQAMRNQRAATVEKDSFTMSIVAPDGYKCSYDYMEGALNIVSINCKP